MTNDSNDALARWRRRTDTPLLCLALIFLVVFLLPLYDSSLSPGVRQGLLAANVAIWIAFAVDYAVRLRMVSNRWAFVRGHIPDLLMIVVPVLRPLRVLRVIGALGTAARRAGERRIAGTTAYVLGAVALGRVVVGAGDGHHRGVRRPVPGHR